MNLERRTTTLLRVWLMSHHSIQLARTTIPATQLQQRLLTRLPLLTGLSCANFTALSTKYRQSPNQERDGKVCRVRVANEYRKRTIKSPVKANNPYGRGGTWACRLCRERRWKVHPHFWTC